MADQDPQVLVAKQRIKNYRQEQVLVAKQRIENYRKEQEAAVPAQGGAGVTLPTAQQGTVTLPRVDQSGGDGGNVSSAPAVSSQSQGAAPGSALVPPVVPAFAASRPPVLRARDMEVVQRDIDGMDNVIRGLKKRQDELSGQAQLLDNRVDAWGRLGYAGSGGDTRRQSEQLHLQAKELGGQIAQLEHSRTDLQKEWDRADQRQFAALMQTENARSAVEKAMSDPDPVSSRKPSHRDVLYAMTYLQARVKGDEPLAYAARQSADMALDRMDEGQRERLAYYVGIGDYDGAAEYLNRIAPALNRAEADALEQGLSKWAQEHPVQGAVTNVVSWPLNIPAYVANARQAAKNLISGKNEQDPHASAYAAAKIGSGTAKGTQEAARSAAAQAFGSETAGEVAAFLTGTGLSIGQNAGQIALLGPGSLAAMSISAAGSATADALDRGATPRQAFIVGTAGGAIEAITEKIPLDNLFRLAKEGGGKGLKATLKELGKQMFTETSEEVISEIANNLVDAAVMEGSSEFQMYVRELQAAGLTEDEAKQQAIKQFYLWNVLLAGAGGAISGGVMGGGAMAFHRAGEYAKQLNTGKQGAAQTNAAIDRAYQAMEKNGMFSQEAGEAIGRAQEEMGRNVALLPTGERALDIRAGAAAQDANGLPQEAGKGPRDGENAAQSAREASEVMIIPQTGQEALQGAQSAAAGQNEAAPMNEAAQADRPLAEEAARIVPESDTDARRNAWLEGLRDTVRQVREDYARGVIDDAAFDGMMDSIEAEAALKGFELPDIRSRLDGNIAAPAGKGAEYGTDRQQGAAPGGQQLSDGDGGRLSGTGAGGEAAGLGTGGPQSAADTGRAAIERQNLGRALRLEAVSSRALGLTSGTDAQTVRLLPEDAWDGALREVARRVRRETGAGVRFVLGGIQVPGNDGGIRQVRGVYSPDGIIVQADHLRVSPAQIADHEIFHSYAQSDPGLIRAAEDAIVERYGQEEMDRIVDTYIKNLRGLVDVPESGTDLEFEQAYADVMNEVLADAFAGINAFGAGADKYQGAVLETLEIRGATSPQGRENARATDSRRGPPEAYSIDYDQNNRPFVTVEEDILAGVPKSEWTARVKKTLAERFPDGVRIGKNTIKINSQTRGEMTFSEYTKRLRKTDGSAYADKLRAAANADEVILASRDYINEGLKHSRKDNIKDFARGTVQLRVGTSDYTADVVVGTTAGGEMLLYDIVNLQKTVIQDNKKSGAEFTAQPHEARGAVDSSTPTQSAAPASDESSIAQPAPVVKPWDGTLPRGLDGSVTLPGAVSDSDTAGKERFSADDDNASNPGTFESGITLNKGNEVIDGSMLPTLEEAQARREQEAGKGSEKSPKSASDPGTGAQAPGTGTAEALPAKARNYLKRAERRLTDKVGELLGVPKSAQREFLQDIVREISKEYLNTGRVSQETRDQLFERAYEQGVVTDREYYDNYKHVLGYLRNTPIEVSKWLQGDISDYNEWRKSAFGTLRLVNKGGIGPDTAYMELQNMAPGLFPDSIIHPADQLRHILDTAKGIRVSEQSLNEAYGPDAAEFKRWARRDFDDAVADALRDLKQVKRYADERAQQAQARQEARAPMTVQEVTALHKQAREAQRNYQRTVAWNLLTQHDEIQVGRLLRGELDLESLSPAKDNVRGITEVYEAKREYEKLIGRIREWNQQRKAQLRAEADGFLETANQWKDKAAGILYSRETMERNIRDIVPDGELADQINKRYFQPVHQAAAAANKMKNKYRDRVRALNLSRKAAKGDAVSEAHAVQLLGEAEDNIRWLEDRRGRAEERDGKTLEDWQAVIAELWENSPGLDQGKIRGAVEEFRAIYDELFQQMNEARVRNGYEPVSYRQGYFPHFQADSEGLMAQFGRALGIETAVTNLPTTINGLTHTFKPGIQWFGNALERKGFDTAYDAVQGFDRYIEGAADVIHQTDNIQALRALAAQARYRTGDEGLRQQVNEVQASKELTDQEKQTLIDEIYKDGRFTLSNFVVELDEYTNLLANKKSRADRNMEQTLGRRMYNIVKGLESRVAANMVAVNPASWLTNFVPLTQGWGTVKTKFMLEGMWDTLKAYKSDDGMVGMSSFLTNRRGSDPIVRTWQQGASAFLSQPMEYIDCFTADSLVRARFKQNQAAGLSEAASIEEADAWAAGVMADRSKGATPTLFNRSNPLTKVFTQFQLEVNNQLSYLFKDLPSDLRKKGLAALAAGLLKFFIGAYLYNELYEYFIGRRCALDPIGILNDTVGDFTGYQMPNLMGAAVDAAQGKEVSFDAEKKSALETATGLGKNVAEELPFVGGVIGGGRVPVSSAMPDWENLAKAALNDGWSGEKRADAALRALSGPATYLALPFGGGQVKKIYQGLKAVIEGGSYKMDGEGRDILQYPVFNETTRDKLLTLPTALLFGKSALPTAREWAERGYKGFSAKQTACYRGMTELGVPQRDAYQLLRDLGNVKAPAGEDVAATDRAAYQKRKLLEDANISAEGKSVVYYTLMASDKERALMDGLAGSGADMGEAARVLMELKDADALGNGKSAAKKKAVAGSSLSELEKDKLFQYMLGKDSKGAALSGSLEKAGLDKRSAAAVANALNALTPEKGKDTVSDAQKWRAVVDTAKGSEKQKAALLAVMSDSARMRYEIGDRYGIQPEAWVQVKEALPQFDENENGSYSGREIENAIDALAGDGRMLAPWDKEPIRLSREEKAVLWQLFSGSTSGSGNPYSARVGNQVAKELERAREEAKAKK